MLSSDQTHKPQSHQYHVPSRPTAKMVQKAQALNESALQKLEIGDQAEAMSLLSQAVGLQAGLCAPLSNLGAILAHLGRDEEALLFLSSAVDMPDCTPDVQHNLGIMQRKVGQIEAAIKTQESLLTKAPGHKDAIQHLASLYLEIRDFPHVEKMCKTGFLDTPEDQALKVILARARILQGDVSAIEISRSAVTNLDEHPTDAAHKILRAHGENLLRINEHKEALHVFETALNLKPGDVETQAQIADCHMKMGNLSVGWKALQVRWESGRVHRPKGNLPKDSAWSGQPLKGKSLLIYAEQGLGDTFMFTRYLFRLHAMGARVTFIPQPSLFELLSLSPLPADIVYEVKNGNFDYHCSLMDLPLYCGTIAPQNIAETVPKMPWIVPDNGRRRVWDQKLTNWFGDAPRIAIAWAGNPKYIEDQDRSIPLAELAPILETQKVVSIQKHDGLSQLATLPKELQKHVLDLSEQIEPGTQAFTDTSAILANCDLVISSDNGIAHLAGAMGVQTALALHHSPEWRWSEFLSSDSEKSPWYPEVRLYRQPQPGDWGTVIANLQKAYPILLKK